MAVQTSYAIYHGSLYAGMLSASMPYSALSKLNNEGSEVAFGLGVATDGAHGFELPSSSSAASDFVGVVKREQNHIGEGAPYNRDATVIPFGMIAVTLASDVDARDPVFWRVGATKTGMFCDAAGSGATLSVAIPGAIFETAGSEGDVVNILMKVGG